MRTVYVRVGRATNQTPLARSPSASSFWIFSTFSFTTTRLEGNQADGRPVGAVKFYFDKYQMTYREPYAADGVSLKPPFCVGWAFEAGESM